MSQREVTMNVRRASESENVSVIEIHGELTAASEEILMEAYARASEGDVRVLLMDFSGLEYMNSGGIGLLVTLLVRTNRMKQSLLACGLNDHYRQILELTRLDEAISVHANEAEAVAAAKTF